MYNIVYVPAAAASPSARLASSCSSMRCVRRRRQFSRVTAGKETYDYTCLDGHGCRTAPALSADVSGG